MQSAGERRLVEHNTEHRSPVTPGGPCTHTPALTYIPDHGFPSTRLLLPISDSMDLGHYYSLLNHTVYGSPNGHSPHPPTTGFYDGLHAFEHAALAEPTTIPLPAEHTVVYSSNDLL